MDIENKEKKTVLPLSDTAKQTAKKSQKRIGIAKGMKLYADDYDIDAPDPEILEMFEV